MRRLKLEVNGVTTTPSRSWFFFWATLALLATVMLAFGPTYYWRTLSGLPDVSGAPGLPLYLHVHAALLTAWFVLPVVQSWLVASGRTHLHRRFGWVGLAIGIALIPAAVLATLRSVPRLKAAPAGPDDAGLATLVVGDLATALVFFPLMLGFALLKRGTPDVHRRWMYLTSLLLLGPALGRFVFVWNQLLLAVAFSPLTWVAALIVYDVKALRRVHPATWWGVGALLLAAGIPPLLGSTDMAHALVQSLDRPTTPP
jgi:hypothetical protein